MTKDELITKQQLEIEELKHLLQENQDTKSTLIGMMCSIGQPLNDNVLAMNMDQLRWVGRVLDQVECINCIDEEEE